MTRLAATVLRRRRLVVVLWTIASVAAVPAAARLSDELSGGGYDVPGSGSQRARQVIARDVLGSKDAKELYVVVPRRGDSGQVDVEVARK